MENRMDIHRLEEKYKTKRKLSDGRFSLVYEMHESKVLKINKPSRNLNDAVYERDLLQELHHDSIVHFVKSDIESGQTLVTVFKYCKIGTLNDYVVDLITNRRLLSGQERICFMKDIAEGVRYLHNNNIMHLNIKPQNVLLTERGKNRMCQLSGFRFARKLGDVEINHSFSEHGPRSLEEASCFSPPEYNIGQTTLKSDIFTLGVVFYALYRLQTEEGQVVAYFNRFRISELQDGIMTPEAIFQVVQDKAVETILLKTFKTRPDDRPTADDICSSLRSVGGTCMSSRKYAVYFASVIGFSLGLIFSRCIKLLKALHSYRT